MLYYREQVRLPGNVPARGGGGQGLVRHLVYIAGGVVLGRSPVALGAREGEVEGLTVEGNALDAVLTIFTCVLVAGISISVFTQYPVKRLLCGVEYSHIPGQYTASFWTSVISLPVILLFIILLGGKPLKNKTRISVLVAVSAVIALASLVYVKNHCSKDMESIYAYDYHAANRQWDKIIAMAEKKTPRTPAEVICLNLALVMKGDSAEHGNSPIQARTS